MSKTKSASSVIDELEAQLQQRARQQDSVAERLADLQPQAHTLQQRLTEQLREVTAQEKTPRATGRRVRYAT